jgi:hypothetical protein
MPEGGILALLSVATGWLLNEVSQFISGRRKTKRRIRVALFSLVELRKTLMDDKAVLEEASGDGSLPREYFRILDIVLEDEWTESNDFKQKMKEILDEIAKIDPYLAHEVRVGAYGMLAIRNRDMTDWSDGDFQEGGVILRRAAATQGVTFLGEVIRKLALRHSVWMWCKVRYNQHNESASTMMPEVIKDLPQEAKQLLESEEGRHNKSL